MKNPLKKVFKKPDLKTQMYGEIQKIRKKLDRELGVLSDKFYKEVSTIRKKSGKINIEKELTILSKKGNSVLADLGKKANKVMAVVKKDYNLAIANVRRRLK